MAQDVTALAKIQAHINLFASAMSAAQKKSDEEIAELKTSNATLQKKIDDEEKKPRPNTQLIQDWKDQVQKNAIETKKKVANQAAADWQVQLDQLRAAQGVLGDMLSKAQSIVKTVFFPAETKLEALGATIGKSPASRSSFPIDDLLGNDKNDQQEVFTLNAVNYLTDSVKIFISSPAADPYSQALIKSTSTIGSGASLDMASGWSWARSCGHQPVLWRCEMTEPRFRRFADKVVNSISRRTRIDRYKARDARTPLPLERGSAALSPSPTYNSAALDLVVRKVMAPWSRWFLDLGQICPP
jgi:Skp family chaperone for outer membrane proteins